MPELEVVGKAEKDLGSMVEGEPSEHCFVLANASGGDVRIATVRTSCGCLVTDLALVYGGERHAFSTGDAVPQNAQLEVLCRIDTLEYLLAETWERRMLGPAEP